MLKKKKNNKIKAIEDLRNENLKENTKKKSKVFKDLEQLIDIHEEGKDFLRYFKQKIRYKDLSANNSKFNTSRNEIQISSEIKTEAPSILKINSSNN